MSIIDEDNKKTDFGRSTMMNAVMYAEDENVPLLKGWAT